ncbi:uncharacterized protein LOC131325293 [Rhododendron vialii]|uniref:uncharacterized protein LOC131325293 n=1 Tax=Rhododendron vialii TaxID=182163 RepID=UPI00265E2E48|nr:uncharacterized protein LOC131325293 [Rhododendron vialii]
MADPEPKSNPSKSYSVFLCKSLFIALVLVSLPLFPSQAPEFISQTILTKLWELLHLLFIGIAVSYGLFGRKNAEIDREIQPKLDSSQTYLSGISHISSIFDNVYENPYGSDEKRMIQNRNTRDLENGLENPYGFDEKIMIQTEKSQHLESEWRKPRSLNFQKDLETAFMDEKKVSETECCLYFNSESIVFVSQENSVLDEWGEKPKGEIYYKPLGLPVRSLRSRIVDHDIPEYLKGNGSGSDSKGSSKDSGKIGFRGLTPINLDQKFKETVSLTSSSGDSRSYRSEVREDKISSNTFVSVGKSESDHINSHSFWSPIFSQTSPKPSPWCSKEIPDSEDEGLEGNGDESSVTMRTRGFSIGSMSEMKPQRKCDPCPKEIQGSEKEGLEGIREESSVTMKTRGFSIGSLSEMKVQRKRDEKLKGFSKSKREEPMGRGNWGVESWKTEEKPKSPVKPFLRGKSVRTIRASENVLEGPKMGDIYLDHLEGKVGKKTSCDKFESRQNLDNFPRKQRSKLSKHHNGERREYVQTNEVESEVDSESEFEKFQVSSEDEEAQSEIANGKEEEEEAAAAAAQSEIANGEELDPNEVDKKAGEFIAKFREQIRLQKIASIKGGR